MCRLFKIFKKEKDIKINAVNKTPNRKRVFLLAKSYLGTKEIKGHIHNNVITGFFKEVVGYVLSDETPWCAAYVGAMLKACELPSSGKLNAKSYKHYGTGIPIKLAEEGDIVVFHRGDPNSWKGHVGFYAGRNGTSIKVLGGNQGNAVTIANYSINRLVTVRRY